MNFIVVSVSIGWLIRLALNLLSYIHLWYIKEYRWDRMWIHLHTKQGRRILFPPIKLPPLAPKTVTLFMASAGMTVAFLVLFPLPISIRFLAVDLLLFPATAVLVLLLKLPTFGYHQYVIWRALKKLRMHTSMTVIGITGSFGKTSTKEYTATILSKQHPVLKTEESKSSPIGIAETILRKLSPENDTFVVELAAYKRGEITHMCSMVRPEIGIVTAINAQHQDLFGNIENTMKAKYELIEGLTGRRIAIINLDNPRTREMARWSMRDGFRVWGYGQEGKVLAGLEKLFQIKNTVSNLSGISFDLSVNKTTEHIAAPILGEGQAGNIAAAIAAAIATGMTFPEAAKGARTIHSYNKRLVPQKGIHGSLFLNDTFNSNPDGVLTGLSVLAKGTGKKIFVFQPMIELGPFAAEAHRRVGEAAAKICDTILLTNDNFSEEFTAGIRSVDQKKSISIATPGQAAGNLRNLIEKSDTVLFSGKEAGLVLAKL